MKKKLDWFKWYPAAWLGDDFVQLLNMEGRGFYFSLLNYQMINGHIPSDFQMIANSVGGGMTTESVARLWEQYKFNTVFVKRDRRWVATDRMGGGDWAPLSEEELGKLHAVVEKLHNETLEQVRAESLGWFSQASTNGKKGYETRQTNEVVRVISKLSEENDKPAPSFDWTPVLKDYPKKKARTGWEAGIQILVDSITTQEEYLKFWAAVKNYKKDMVGKEEKYVKSLSKFMTEWTGWVPANYRPVLRPTPPQPKEGEVPGRRVLMHLEKPPWEPEAYTTPVQREQDKKFWTPVRQERWWNNQPTLDPNDPLDTEEIKKMGKMFKKPETQETNV